MSLAASEAVTKHKAHAWPAESREASCSWASLGRFTNRVLFFAASVLRCGSAERNHFPLEAFGNFAVFADLPKLVLAYAGERLMRAACWPIHFNSFDLPGLAQADVLLEGRSSK